MTEKLQNIIDKYEDTKIQYVDGLDDAVIGVSEDFTEPRLIYSVSKCLSILESDMNADDALEHFTFNISGGYLGPKTPIWCWDLHD